jgi:hypothetical protein
VSIQVKKIAGGANDTIATRRYHGMTLVAGAAAAAHAEAYAGDGNGDPQVGATQCLQGETDRDFIPGGDYITLDHGAPAGKLFVEVTGAAAYALVYFEPL